MASKPILHFRSFNQYFKGEKQKTYWSVFKLALFEVCTVRDLHGQRL
jgi:hypothetical protein